MNARALFDQLMAGRHAALRDLIADSPAETPYFDFKQKGQPAKGEEAKPPFSLYQDDRKNYAKSLSGFANAGGGVILWGIGEQGKGETRKLRPCPVQSVKQFCERLNAMLPQAVVPMIEGVQNEPIYEADDEGSNSGYVLTFVPESAQVLHRAEFHLKQYCRRIGESMVCLDHHSIEDAFGVRLRPKLELLEIAYQQHSNGPPVQYDLRLTVRNDGRSLAQHFGVDLEFPADLRPQNPRLDGRMRLPGEPASALVVESDSIWVVKLRSPTTAHPYTRARPWKFCRVPTATATSAIG